jgi:hypothetical protein
MDDRVSSNKDAGAIWVVPSRDGAAVKVIDLGNAKLSSSIDWSPDGSRLDPGKRLLERLNFPILCATSAGRIANND